VTVHRVLDEMEEVGVTLRLDGEKVVLRFPEPEYREKLAEHVAFLRTRRDEVAELLRRRTHESDEHWPPESDRYAAQMQAALAEINRSGHPGTILWLDTAQPELYMELTSEIPDEIDRLWNSSAPLNQFQAVLDRLVAVHRQCCQLYSEARAGSASRQSP
jgi:hypothetical protein